MQTDFFEQEQNTSPQSGETVRKRVFLYDGQYFEDPGPKYSIEDVMNFLAETYPELQHGTWHSRTLPDNTEEITFVKVIGEKGSRVQPADIAARLATVPPANLQVVSLLEQLITISGEISAEQLLSLSPDIEAALHQSEQLSSSSQEVVKRCLDLQPVPHPKVPLGF